MERAADRTAVKRPKTRKLFPGQVSSRTRAKRKRGVCQWGLMDPRTVRTYVRTEAPRPDLGRGGWKWDNRSQWCVMRGKDGRLLERAWLLAWLLTLGFGSRAPTGGL